MIIGKAPFQVARAKGEEIVLYAKFRTELSPNDLFGGYSSTQFLTL